MEKSQKRLVTQTRPWTALHYLYDSDLFLGLKPIYFRIRMGGDDGDCYLANSLTTTSTPLE